MGQSLLVTCSVSCESRYLGLGKEEKSIIKKEATSQTHHENHGQERDRDKRDREQERVQLS